MHSVNVRWPTWTAQAKETLRYGLARMANLEYNGQDDSLRGIPSMSGGQPGLHRPRRLFDMDWPGWQPWTTMAQEDSSE